eukprot:10640768-Ditylum_brightwellii.AAC.2
MRQCFALEWTSLTEGLGASVDKLKIELLPLGFGFGTSEIMHTVSLSSTRDTGVSDTECSVCNSDKFNTLGCAALYTIGIIG